MNILSSSSKISMIKRILTGMILMGILIPGLIFGEWFFFALIAVVSVVGTHELLKAPGPSRYNFLVKTVVYLFVLSFIFWAFIKSWYGNPNPLNGQASFFMDNIFVSILAISLYALVLFLIAVCSPKFQLHDVTYLFTMGVIFALGIQGMMFIRYFPNNSGVNYMADTIISTNGVEVVTHSNYFSSYFADRGLDQKKWSCLLFFYTLIGTWGADVGAYFIGVLFGKHRMNPRISPHKTWEGFFGGWILSIAASMGFAAIMEFCFDVPLIPGLLQYKTSPLLNSMNVVDGSAWQFIMALSVLMPVVGNIGGFLFSLIKRQFGIKDFGRLFPGHGGIIDRFDSVLTNSLLISVVLMITASGWNIFV